MLLTVLPSAPLIVPLSVPWKAAKINLDAHSHLIRSLDDGLPCLSMVDVVVADRRSLRPISDRSYSGLLGEWMEFLGCVTMVEDTMTVVYEPILQADTVEAKSQDKGEILMGITRAWVGDAGRKGGGQRGALGIGHGFGG